MFGTDGLKRWSVTGRKREGCRGEEREIAYWYFDVAMHTYPLISHLPFSFKSTTTRIYSMFACHASSIQSRFSHIRPKKHLNGACCNDGNARHQSIWYRRLSRCYMVYSRQDKDK
jgi:hypothetical protein